MIHFKGLGDLEDGHDGGIPLPSLQSAEIVLGEARAFRQLLLGPALLQTHTPDVSANEEPHVHAPLVAVCRRQLYILEYISRLSHHWLMAKIDSTQPALELLSELLSRPFLSDNEQLPLRQLAALRIQAHALSCGGLSDIDRQAFTLVVARWLQAFTDKEGDFEHPADAFELTSESLGAVLSYRPNEIETSLRNLSAADLIALQPDRISLEPVLAQIAADLLPVLYRDCLDRHGRTLRDMATFYSESLAEDLEELITIIPEDPRAVSLQRDLEALTSRATPDALLAQWPNAPALLYAWLDDLAAIEQRMAILTADPETGLANDLQRGSAERIFFLSGRFAPRAPDAPAQAA